MELKQKSTFASRRDAIQVKSSAVKQPTIISNNPNVALQMLLGVEEDSRGVRTPSALHFMFANETRKLTRARQVFVFRSKNEMRLVTISGLPAVDRSAPIVRSIEKVVMALGEVAGLQEPREFEFLDFGIDEEDFLKRYPYQQVLWLPLKVHDGEVLGGMLLASEQNWGEADVAIATRMAGIFSHSLALLLVKPRIESQAKSKFVNRRRVGLAAVLALIAVMFTPVPMTVLAPLEIAPRDPFIVAAPLEGVIGEILVSPNETVKEGQPIVRFEDTELRNRLEVAERQVLVAEARLKKQSQLAFSDKKQRNEVRLFMAEHALETAELHFVREMFNQATINSPRTGVAIYSNKQGLLGKPVSIGERIMQIADPTQIEIALDVNVNDAIVLRPGARVKVFLDSSSLFSREAKIEYADYKARSTSGTDLAFHAIATFSDTKGAPPRLGTRGTAHIYGEDVPLALYLFRRPLSALRQWVGA